MKRLLLSLCLLAALVAAMFTATPCVAQPANGVIAQERIVSLPQDSGKWYVSVVGDPQDARYREVLNWFESGSLLNLRNSVHFNAVTSDSAIFAERYAANTPSLPMVRLQNSQGVVYSQVCSSDIPMTAQSLNSLISQDVASGPKAQCDLHRSLFGDGIIIARLRSPSRSPRPIRIPIRPQARLTTIRSLSLTRFRVCRVAPASDLLHRTYEWLDCRRRADRQAIYPQAKARPQVRTSRRTLFPSCLNYTPPRAAPTFGELP